MLQNIKITPITAPWITSATKIPDKQIGEYRITTDTIQPNLYKGLAYKHYFWVKEPIQYKRLQVQENGKWHDWMVDNPQHWMSTWELAMQARGRVLVGGLGLGLLLHHLKSNCAVTHIQVVEKSYAVIELVKQHISKCYVYYADFFSVLPNMLPIDHSQDTHYDTIITDFHMGEKEYLSNARETVACIKQYYPDAKILTHAYQNQFDVEEFSLHSELVKQLLYER